MRKDKKGEEKVQIYCDGGARGNPGPGACAFAVIKDKKIIHEESMYLGEVTNNVAEYNGVLYALKWLQANNGYHYVQFFLDSQLVVNQLKGVYKIKNENLKILRETISNLEKSLNSDLDYQYIPRDKNKLADKLLNIEIDENL